MLLLSDRDREVLPSLPPTSTIVAPSCLQHNTSCVSCIARARALVKCCDACARVAWREDGRRLASASDDRTVRVWDVECNGGDGDGSDDDEWSGMRGKNCNGRLLWTGWGHASRVWDVGFTRLGIVTCGEVRCRQGFRRNLRIVAPKLQIKGEKRISIAMPTFCPLSYSVVSRVDFPRR